MENPITFRISVYLEDMSAILYSQDMPPMPIPRVGEDVFVSSPPIHGWWTIKMVDWSLPQITAMTPTMWVSLFVSWSERNNRPAPVYDDEKGWTPG